MNRWIFVLAFALVFYGNGAAIVETVVNYPSWRLIGANLTPPAPRCFCGWLLE